MYKYIYIYIYIYSWSNIDIAYFLTSLAASDRLGLRLLVVKALLGGFGGLQTLLWRTIYRNPLWFWSKQMWLPVQFPEKSYPLLAMCTLYSLLWLMDALSYTYRHPSLLGDDWWHPSQLTKILSFNMISACNCHNRTQTSPFWDPLEFSQEFWGTSQWSAYIVNQ